MNVKITKESLLPLLIYNSPIKYDEYITIYPVTMRDVITFQFLESSITLRKNSIFREKKIIKMTYLDFLLYTIGNAELENQYDIPGLSKYYYYVIQLLQLCCKNDKVTIDQYTGRISINEEIITPHIFDDLRRIIIIQNDIDFDIDEFMNRDTELVIAMHVTEDYVMNMTIRKFWRYIKRYNLHETYTIAKTGECSGFVKFKEPIKHWMISFDKEDKYSNLKADENELRSKVSG